MSKTFRRKDPKKVAAGRKGGKLSGGNFKHSKERAAMAGRKSAWERQSGKLGDFPVGLIDEHGEEIAFPDDHTVKMQGIR